MFRVTILSAKWLPKKPATEINTLAVHATTK